MQLISTSFLNYYSMFTRLEIINVQHISIRYRSIIDDDVVPALPYKVHGSMHHNEVIKNSKWLLE